MIITAAILVAVLGGVFGLVLATASKKFAVEEDPRIGQIVGLLPGANCGGCGYAGCASMADAIVSGKEPGAVKCAACSAENKKQIKAIMGLDEGEDENAVRMIPRLHCNGCVVNRKPVADREGIKNCYVAAATFGGSLKCNFGCFGFGACADACNFGALSIGKNGLPVFDYDKCVGCGACSKACPQLLIEMQKATNKVLVQCNNREKGKAAMTNCNVSCISCGICAKTCPKQAITIEDGVNGSIPVIDYDKCVGCGLCTMKCPRKCLVKVVPIEGGKVVVKNPVAAGCQSCKLAADCPSKVSEPEPSVQPKELPKKAPAANPAPAAKPAVDPAATAQPTQAAQAQQSQQQ
jgi:electron transport complex protein RnfB